jgi:hypothetical protein
MDGATVGTNTVDLPLRVLDYVSEPLRVTREELRWLPKDTVYGRRRYRADDDFSTDISVVLMGTDRTSIHRPQICLEGQGWTIARSELQSIRISKPRIYDLTVMKLTARRALKDEHGRATEFRALFVYWFVSETRLTARHGERMWWMAKDLLATGVLPRWAYVAYIATCRPGEEAATYDRMKEFIAASVPEFQVVTGLVETHPQPPGAVALRGPRYLCLLNRASIDAPHVTPATPDSRPVPETDRCQFVRLELLAGASDPRRQRSAGL